MQNSLWRVFFSENANLQNHCWCKLLVVKVGLRYRTGYCRLWWILSEVQQPTSLRIHKSDWILGRYPPVILNVTRITAIPRLILIDPLSLTMPCLQVKDIIILLRVSAEQWPLFKWKTRLITTQVSQLWQLEHVRVHYTTHCRIEIQRRDQIYWGALNNLKCIIFGGYQREKNHLDLCISIHDEPFFYSAFCAFKCTMVQFEDPSPRFGFLSSIPCDQIPSYPWYPPTCTSDVYCTQTIYVQFSCWCILHHIQFRIGGIQFSPLGWEGAQGHTPNHTFYVYEYLLDYLWFPVHP